MSKVKPTSVTFLLDRTGSMESIKDDTIGAFNAYLDGLKGADSITFSLVQFDSQSLDKVCIRVPIDQVPRLTKDNFQPRAATPLIDAAYKTIKAVEASVSDADQVVICIQTDGHENASTEYTWNDLNALIKEKTALGWQFIFMGAGIDAYDQGARMGILASNTLSHGLSGANTQAAYAASALNTANFARGTAMNVNFSAEQKSASGDLSGFKTVNTPPVAVTRKKPAKTKPSIDDFKL